MAISEQSKIIKTFYGGITRDEKSKINGVASNIEELDIFTNADYIQAEQIFTADSLPASSEAYAFTSGNTGIAYALGKETSASKVRLFSVASGGASNPGSWATLITSADTTNLSYSVSPIQYFSTTEALPNALYFVTKTAANVVKLCKFEISAGTDFTVVGTLTGLTGSYDRISMKVIFGELYITNGKYIASVDKDGVFTNDKFTLPNEWTSVDIIAVSDVAVILGRYVDRTVNFCKGFWWDLTNATQVDDSFNIPSGGPQWMVNHKENVKICTSINGTTRFYQLSGAFPGAVPLELPGLVLTNSGTEGATQPISASKMVAEKDKILYFGLYKSDKTGVYAIGQLDSDKPIALLLSKRFATTDYSLHAPTALMILGSNYYGAYVDNGTASTVRCETLNSPSRSSSGVYESIVIDGGEPTVDKNLFQVVIPCQPLPASTDINVSVAPDYGSYTEIFRSDGTSLNTTNATIGLFDSTHTVNNKTWKIKVQLVSNTTSSPKVTGVGFSYNIKSKMASK